MYQEQSRHKNKRTTTNIENGANKKIIVLTYITKLNLGFQS